jgi:hypothetical protein
MIQGVGFLDSGIRFVSLGSAESGQSAPEQGTTSPPAATSAAAREKRGGGGCGGRKFFCGRVAVLAAALIVTGRTSAGEL